MDIRRAEDRPPAGVGSYIDGQADNPEVNWWTARQNPNVNGFDSNYT
jgi:hypothetical protein